jgi:uncharacterized phage protein (TIGR01671 family)
MKELKFRIWSKRVNQYIDIDTSNYDFSLNELFYELQKNHVVQQFTGLKDVNGKDIYEGDIIRYEYPEQPRYSRKGYENPNLPDNMSVIRWTREGEDNHPGFRVYDLNGQGGKIEVIGNIFENSELLNK